MKKNVSYPGRVVRASVGRTHVLPDWLMLLLLSFNGHHVLLAVILGLDHHIETALAAELVVVDSGLGTLVL